MNGHSQITNILLCLRSAPDTTGHGHFFNAILARNMTGTHERTDFKDAVAKVLEAQKATVARGKTVTKSIPRHERARQGEAQDSNAFGTGKPGAGTLNKQHT